MKVKKSRAAFERFITKPPFEKDITRFPAEFGDTAWPGAYVQLDVDLAWQAWRRATRRANNNVGV